MVPGVPGECRQGVSSTIQRLLIVTLWLSLLQPLGAAGQYVEVSDLEQRSLTDAVSLFEDPSAQLSFEDIHTRENLARFKPSTEATNFGFTSSAWWVQVALRNSGTESKRLILRQDYPLIDYLDFWSLSNNDSWVKHETGDRRLFDTRQIVHREFLYEVELPAGREAAYFFRFETSGAMNIGLSAHSPADLIETIGKEHLAYGSYYGGFVVLILYNLFIFAVVRDRTFAYYLLYVASYGLYFAVHNGLTYQFLWPNSPAWGNQSLIILLCLTLFWGTQFSRKILSMDAVSRRMNMIAVGLQVFSALALVIGPFLPYSLAIVPIALLTLVTVIWLFVMGLVALLTGTRSARYYMLAWSALLVGVVIYMLKTFGWLPHNALTHNAFQLGALVEMVLLSIALATRVEELRLQSRTDALTQLGNRLAFDEQFATEFDRAKRYGQSLSLLLADIDKFKDFNDRYGHASGDEALREVAQCLKDTGRKYDVICRYGGEEFVLLLPSTDRAAATAFAERARQTVEQQVVAGAQVTISIGVASLPNSKIETPQALFEATDQALYLAKELGRNRVEIHESTAAFMEPRPLPVES